MISGGMPYAHYSFPDNLWSCRRACSEPFVTKANLACYLGLCIQRGRGTACLAQSDISCIWLFQCFAACPSVALPWAVPSHFDTMGIKLGFLATNIHQGWILIPFTLSLYTKSSLYRRHDALHRTCSDFHTTSLVILLICSTDSNWSLSLNDSSISSSPYFFMVSYIILTGVIRFVVVCHLR